MINAAIPAWTPEAERNFLLQEGFGYQPDLVLLDFTIVNDIYGRGPAVSEQQTIFQFLRDHTYGWPFLTTQARFLLAKQKGPEAIPVLNPPRDASAYYPLEEDSPVWEEIWGFIREMDRACREREIGFVVILFPTAFQLNSAQHPELPQRIFTMNATIEGVKIIDLLPMYRQVCETATPSACEGYENLLFADVWMHPNFKGHQITAQALSEEIPLSGNSD